MQLSPALWAEVKLAERGHGGGGPQTPLSLRARLLPSADQAAFAAQVRNLGGRLSGRARRGDLRLMLPAAQVPQLARWPGLSRLAPVEVSTAQAKLPWRRLIAAALSVAAAGLLLWALAAADWKPAGMIQRFAVWLNGPPAKGPQKRTKPKLWGDVDDYQLRTKPKPKVEPEAPPGRRPGKPRPALLPPTAPTLKAAAPAAATPEEAKDLYQAGLSAYYRQQTARAVNLWQQALSRNPGRLEVRRSLGWALFELNRRQEALAQFLYILRQRPQDPEALAALEIFGRRPPRVPKGPAAPAKPAPRSAPGG